MVDREHGGCVARLVIPWLSGLVSLEEIEMLGKGEFRGGGRRKRRSRGREEEYT